MKNLIEMSVALLEKTSSDLDEKLFTMFEENDVVDDKEVHSLAEEMGIDPDEVENSIYKILSSFLRKGRWNENGRPEISGDELDKGIKVEMEHTSDERIAERIAKDHLVECSDYYTRLANMEKECGVKD